MFRENEYSRAMMAAFTQQTLRDPHNTLSTRNTIENANFHFVLQTPPFCHIHHERTLHDYQFMCSFVFRRIFVSQKGYD